MLYLDYIMRDSKWTGVLLAEPPAEDAGVTCAVMSSGFDVQSKGVRVWERNTSMLSQPHYSADGIV